jgi:hypothetical protein
MPMQYIMHNPQHVFMYCVKICEEEKMKKEEISMRLEDREVGTRNWTESHYV